MAVSGQRDGLALMGISNRATADQLLALLHELRQQHLGSKKAARLKPREMLGLA
jgi:hypothetical protein